MSLSHPPLPLHARIPLCAALKCVGGESTVAEYAQNHRARAGADWAGLYLQVDLGHCASTAGYRWEQGYSRATVLRCELEDLHVVIVGDSWMADGALSGEEKATRLKRMLGFEETSPLMESLARSGKALVCRETHEQWEIVLGDPLVERYMNALGKCESVLEMEKDSKCMFTARCRAPPDGKWERFEEARFSEYKCPQWLDVIVRQQGQQEETEMGNHFKT